MKRKDRMKQIKNKYTGEVMCGGLSLEEVLEKHRLWLENEEGGERADLRFADLYYAELRDAVLRGANLSDTNLSDANMYHADLRDTDLRSANMRGANLRGANLRDANLRGANLRGADLCDADLCDANLGGAYLGGAYLGGANLRGANLGDANLRGANLRGANLRGAYLGDAYLRGANLGDANLRGANLGGVPECLKVRNIHQAIYNAASKEGALDMASWHACETTHCRAGWVIHLAGDAGKVLEWQIGTPAAAALIYMISDPDLEKIPNFYCSNEEALEDMRLLAEKEKENA